MDALVPVLRRYGIDTGQIQPVYEAGAETSYYVPVPGQDALVLWARLRELTERTGYWPVLLGHEQYDVQWQDELHEDAWPLATQTVIAAAEAMDARHTLQAMLADAFGPDPSVDSPTYRGLWPADMPPSTEILTPYKTEDSTFLPRPLVYLGLVPTRLSWQVPIFLGFGNWNDCPAPETHGCVLKYWEAGYGAEIVALTHDVIEMRVARPPQDPAAALALAHEQFAYCYDIVAQGTETIDRLAATLLHGTAWYFWWD